MYQASLGAPSNETSGVAINERKAQGEASTANFPANMAASITQVGRLIGQMVPKLIDTRRQLRILGIDSQPGQISIDPKQAQAVAETPQGLVINPNVGKYDVRVTVGASFSTQRTQAQQQFTELMRAAPNLMPAVAPLWAQTLDIQNSDKLAEVLIAVAPPEVQAVLKPKDNKEPSTAELSAKLEQMNQALEQAIAVAKEAEQDLDECQAKLQEAEDKNAIAAYEAETKRMVGLKDAINPAQVQQLVVQTIEQMLSNPNPLPGEEPEEMAEQPDTYEMQPFPGGEEPQPEMVEAPFPTEPEEAPFQ
jgi:exonuclease VII small subunit